MASASAALNAKAAGSAYSTGSAAIGRLGARDVAPIRFAFRQRSDVGTREKGTFAAQWLACALPCQCFAMILAGHCA
jgi:hypothetical protein